MARRGGRGPAAQRGADLETTLTIPFEDAMTGTTAPVRIDGPAVCSRCHGSGAEPGTEPITCPRCQGSGEIAENQGFFSMSRPCPQCGGAGRIVESPCTRCGGTGAERRTRTLKVKIPAGVKHGHGATATTAVTHIAIQEAVDGKAVEWMEHVTEEQYKGK